MISNAEKPEIKSEGRWHYLALKLSALLRGTTSKNTWDIFCVNCRHSFRTKSKLDSYKRTCKNKNVSNVIMLSEDTKMLKQYLL